MLSTRWGSSSSSSSSSGGGGGGSSSDPVEGFLCIQTQLEGGSGFTPQSIR